MARADYRDGPGPLSKGERQWEAECTPNLVKWSLQVVYEGVLTCACARCRQDVEARRAGGDSLPGLRPKQRSDLGEGEDPAG